MARRTLHLAAALAATATLLLTACGGSDDASDDIKGADKASGTPSASASDPTHPATARPKVELPADFKLTFRDWTSSDPTQQDVLTDGKEQVRAGYAAVVAGNPDDADFAFYNTPEALTEGKSWIRTYSDRNLTVFGDLPAYDPKVTLLGENKTRAVLTYCTDESKAYTKNRKTGGDVQGNPKGTDPKVFYTTTVQKNAQGVWQARNVQSKRGGC